uniref:Ig-like domain-containing protein n=1 Tax=Seriola dumerili TaxID=41447 RepID=A0A3B4TI51_SERDU
MDQVLLILRVSNKSTVASTPARPPTNMGRVRHITTNVFLFFLILIEQYPPAFVTKPDPQTVYVGKRAMIQCVITGSAPLNVVWLKDNQDLPKVPAQYQTFLGLKIQDCREEDVGTYQCMVANEVGSCTGFAALSLKGCASCSTILTVQGQLLSRNVGCMFFCGFCSLYSMKIWN